ncbi:hypothetical protein [Paraburkholderia fynbosensis]|uniref:Uncharacterized protein n=1 Tax=Paraburkholderia fynbosensis TaxID=1200993 RepID=A0A6J5FKF2_9BURK|nr:hypothetical protein [Paraburkholderia fynbosensis]CAB3782184.1 hypothetical protein LMG27177_01185 [Paraburkholderia fynbosensis]
MTVLSSPRECIAETLEVKNWRSVLGMLGGIIAVVIVSAYGATSLGKKPYDPSLMASWVQAVGSIATILGAIFVGRTQSEAQHKSALEVQHAALRRRWATVKALLDPLYQQCIDIENAFDGDHDFGNLSFALRYDSTAFEEALDRLRSIPLFELDSDVLVTSIIGVGDSARSLKMWIVEGQRRALGKPTGLDASDAQVKDVARDQLARIKKHYAAAVMVVGGKPITAPRPLWQYAP